MAIYKMVGDKDSLEEIPATSFGQEGVLERADLQRILRDKPEVLEEGLLIISEEFGNWQDSNRRIDLLGLDSTGRLVVIELKRGETGSYMDLQAIRYAAMVANMTFDQAVDTYQEYLEKRADNGEDIEEDAAEILIRDHLAGIEEVQSIGSDIPRIILASENFSKELTTCVMWLNDSWLRNEGLDIKCIRLQPHRNVDQVLIETSVVVPLPEASEYQTQLAQRERESRVQNTGLVHGRGKSQQFDGDGEFIKSLSQAQDKFKPGLQRLYESAVALKKIELTEFTTHVNSRGDLRLELWVPGKDCFLVSFNNLLHKGGRGGEISFWPGWEETAPKSRIRLNGLIGPPRASNGFQHRRLSRLTNLDEVLNVIHEAYREANGRLNGAEEPEPPISDNL